MDLRISTGVLKNRKLNTPKNAKPAMDKVRQSIINILRNEIVDANVLDLYCGVGTLGIECLSNGANKVTFVENNKTVANLIEQNMHDLEIHPTRYLVINNSASSYLKTNSTIFDLIFIDPFYKINIQSELKYLPKFMHGNSIVVLLISRRQEYNYRGLELIDKRIYGQTKVDFLKKSDII